MKIRIVKPDAPVRRLDLMELSFTPSIEAYAQSDTIEIDIDKLVSEWIKKYTSISDKSFSQYLQELGKL